jgi:hypothetical protein
MLRIQLINNRLGSRIIDRYDPIGINDLTFEIKRSEENDGIVYNVIFDLEFIKPSRDYLKSCFESDGGIDSEVIVKIWQRDVNRRRWKIYAIGKVNWNGRELFEDRIVVTIEQTGFERRVLNLMNSQVDMETDVTENGSAIVPIVLPELEYHSKTIKKLINLKPENGDEYQSLVWTITIPDAVLELDVPVSILSVGQLSLTAEGGDIEEFNNTSYIYQSFPLGTTETAGFPTGGATQEEYIDFLTSHPTLREHNFVSPENGTTDVVGTLTLKHKAHSINGGGDIDNQLGNLEVIAWLEQRDVNNNILSIQNVGSWNFPTHGQEIIGEFETKEISVLDIPSSKGDKFYLYTTYLVYGDYESPVISDGDGTLEVFYTIQADVENTSISITSKTNSPIANVKTALIYEAAERCAQFYTNQTDCFRSTLLGRTDILDSDGNPLYDEDGEAALLGYTNGHFLRGNNEKKLFLSLNDILEFVNMRYCAGIGFETINGKQYLVLEKKEYFFNKNLKISSLGPTYNVKKRLDSKRFWNEIELGYSGKLDIGQTNAIDEFNTLRKWSIPIVNTQNKLKLTTKVRASGFQIEFQKRLKGTTKDSNLDDENFIVSLIRDGETFKTKKDEGYTSITGVFDSPSGYNYDLSPARALQRWKKFIASCLTKSFDKTLKFAGGEGNYTMTTQKIGEEVVSESGDVDVSAIEPDFEPEVYGISRKLGIDDIALIQNNRYGYEEFSDQFGEVMQGFILNIEHNPTEKMAELELLKVFRA